MDFAPTAMTSWLCKVSRNINNIFKKLTMHAEQQQKKQAKQKIIKIKQKLQM